MGKHWKKLQSAERRFPHVHIFTGATLTSLWSTWWAMVQPTGLTTSSSTSFSLIFFKVCPDLPTMPVAQWDGSQGGVRVCGVQVSASQHTYFRARHTPKTKTLFFRCCYCYYWNPARKQRPVAPRWHFEQGILNYNPTPARLPDAATLPQSGASSDTSDDDRYL